MKKVLSLIICILLIASLSAAAFAENDTLTTGTATKQLLVDEAGVLTDSEFNELSALMQQMSEENNFDFCVAFVNGHTGDVMTYSDNFFLDHGFGQGADLDGCLLFVDMDSRDYWLSTSGFGLTAFSDYGVNVINERHSEYLSEGRYYDAVKIYLSTAEDYVQSAKLGLPYDVDREYQGYSASEYGRDNGSSPIKSAGMSFIIALVISAVVVFSIKKSYKAVAFQRSAGNYLNEGSLAVTSSYEHFLYTTVSKTKKASESKSGGSSSHSTSGHSFGGGGGKF